MKPHDCHNATIARTEESMPLGKTVERMTALGMWLFVVTHIYDDGLVILTPIPKGSNATDLGRQFPGAIVEVVEGLE